MLILPLGICLQSNRLSVDIRLLDGMKRQELKGNSLVIKNYWLIAHSYSVHLYRPRASKYFVKLFSEISLIQLGASEMECFI